MGIYSERLNRKQAAALFGVSGTTLAQDIVTQRHRIPVAKIRRHESNERQIMILASADTWPKALLDYLESQHDMLLAYTRHENDTMSEYLRLRPTPNHISISDMPPNPYRSQWEQATSAVLALLQSTDLRGWHCTRLTRSEISDIKQNGMQLPNLTRLRERIMRIYASRLINMRIRDRLLTENQADVRGRKEILWFCFFPPRLAGQSCIERFFRRWGGEALYCLHEQDIETGEALKTIGTPCLIEADVTVSTFVQITRLGKEVIRQHLSNHGFDTDRKIMHEDMSHETIPARNIARIILHNHKDFAELTGCDEWSPPL